MLPLPSSMSAFALCLGLGFLANVIHAQQTNFFVNPPSAGPQEVFFDNPVFTIDEEIEVRWSTDLESYSVGLWQQSLGIRIATAGSNVYSKIPGGPEEGAFNWTVDTLGFSLSQSNVFYFNLTGTLDGETSVITSHYFNLTSAAAKATTTSPSIGIPSSGSTAGPSLPSGSTVDPPLNSSSADTDNNTPAKVGIGVGLGLGIPLLALMAYLGFLHRKRGRRNDASHSNLAPLYIQQPLIYEESDSAKELPAAANHSRGDVPEQQLKRYRDHNEPVELDAERRSH